MMLVQFDDVSLDFADQCILREANWVLEPKERVALVGRNGAGKSTLMKIMTGEQAVDAGEIRFRDQLRVAKLQQELPTNVERRVEAVVTEGLADIEALIQQFEQCTQAEQTEEMQAKLATLQRDIEAHGGWHIEQRVDTIITQLGLPRGRTLSELSGGWRRRVLLGKALVAQPDVLLLDEPTNHLDIATIEWLEHTIRAYPGAIVFVTHDRYFLQNVATRILEIDRGSLRSFPGNYDRYVDMKSELLATELEQNAVFDKKLAEEEAWIRRGVKARCTRNMGRVRALESLRDEAEARIKPQGRARIAVQNAEQSARKVIEARGVCHGYQGDSIKIMRGDRVGLIGNNGLGKSTLLRILLGELEPNAGSVKLGENLQIAYFDQTRRELDLTKSVAYNVGQGKDYISVNGKDRHVIGYLKNFLFSPERATTPVGALSGGERNRVLLAKLFARPSNLMILDEPTNDLDVEMLEVLEEQLMAYSGTLLLVSHDRQFLDNVVTSTLVFEGNGVVATYVGGYSDWLRQGGSLAVVDRPKASADAESSKKSDETPSLPERGSRASTRPKLSYKEQRELSLLPGEIQSLESDIERLQHEIAASDFYQQSHDVVSDTLQKLAAKESLLDEKMERWLELDS
ncbi:MAG: ATP-binding cassette domain-containing protein [Gammaproteobacteria bacterium]